MTTIFGPFGLHLGVMVKWSKNLTMAMAKISKLMWSNGQNLGEGS